MTEGFNPGSIVAASPTFSPFQGATERIGARARAPAAATTGPGSANGMIFTVATMRPASTGANSGSVATVSPGSRRFSASTPARSTTRSPALSA